MKCEFHFEGRRVYNGAKKKKEMLCAYNGVLFLNNVDEPDASCHWEMTKQGLIKDENGRCFCHFETHTDDVGTPIGVRDCDYEGCLWEGAETWYGASICGAGTKWDPYREICVVGEEEGGDDEEREDERDHEDHCGYVAGTRNEEVLEERDLVGSACDCENYCSTVPNAKGWRWRFGKGMDAAGENDGVCVCLAGKKLALVPSEKSNRVA